MKNIRSQKGADIFYGRGKEQGRPTDGLVGFGGDTRI